MPLILHVTNDMVFDSTKISLNIFKALCTLGLAAVLGETWGGGGKGGKMMEGSNDSQTMS